jgi:hypothetical protein
VPQTLHEDFIQRLGDGANGEASLREWYTATVDALKGQSVGDDLFVFWRGRFADWVGTVTTTRVSGKGNATRDAMARAVARLSAKGSL